MTLAAVVSLNSTTTGTERQVAQAPSRYALYQNYPNPFNPVTTIRFSIPQDELVTLAVYDITGREVATLLNYHLSAGTYTVQWNARAAASGVYYAACPQEPSSKQRSSCPEIASDIFLNGL